MRKSLVVAAGALALSAAVACTYTIPPTVLRGVWKTKPIPGSDGGVEYEAIITSVAPAGAGPGPVADGGTGGGTDSGVKPDGGADAGTPVADGGTAQPDAGLPPNPPTASALGFNLDLIWSGGEFAFADKMRMSRGWVSGTFSAWDDGRAIPVDAAGWPTALAAGQHAIALVPTHNLAERFVITWQGSGAVVVSDVASTVSNAAGRIEINSDPNVANMIVRITSLPVTNMQVRRASNPTSAVWEPEFLASLQGSKVIRTMQWSVTNGEPTYIGNQEKVWTDRPVAGTVFQRPKISWEWQIALANATDTDLWICLPHLADDNYARQLGLMVSTLLSPSHKVYVEYSNEVWNGSFLQSQYAIQQGVAAGLHADQYIAGRKWQARRSLQVWQAFEAGFGNGTRSARVVRVLGGQGGWESMYDQMFAEVPAGSVDAIAMAPYVGGGIGKAVNAPAARSGGVNWVFQMLGPQLAETFSEIDGAARSAAKYHVALIAYEGGQHLVWDGDVHNDQALVDIFIAAQQDPRMFQLYKDLLAKWKSAGGGVFVHYTLAGSWSKWGEWGSCPANNKCATSQKYNALKSWAAGQ